MLGFDGSTRAVSEWATRRRRSERMTAAQLHRPPSARTIARLMTSKRDHLTKAETLTVAAIEGVAPALAEARTLIDRFQSIIRRKASVDLDLWLLDAEPGLIASFARGIIRDCAAGSCPSTWWKLSVAEAAPFQATSVEICSGFAVLPMAMRSAMGSVCM
ncbi:hypothetical protein Sa4125_15150 [Aureimonas sp. SA4125]|nr:hypothetical protein Sa4125_15150 [Aureimonas sp. SA4125]